MSKIDVLDPIGDYDLSRSPPSPMIQTPKAYYTIMNISDNYPVQEYTEQ